MTPTELRAVLLERLPVDPRWVAWVEGVVERVGTVEDPRIARIAALCDDVTSDEFGFTPEEEAGAERLAYEVRAVLGEVQPTPPHGTDRDALAAFLAPMLRAGWHAEDVAREALSLALVRPVEGVVLTPEEATRARAWYETGCAHTGPDWHLARRLEQASLAARLGDAS